MLSSVLAAAQNIYPEMRITSSLALIGGAQFGISAAQDCHIYAIKGPSGTVVVDAGAGAHTEELFSTLRFDLDEETVATLLITHAHLDHCGGAAKIRAKTDCKVIASREAARILEAADEQACGLSLARRQGMYPHDFHLSSCTVNGIALHGENFEAGGLNWQVWRVRGHSDDSVCYSTELEGRNWFFCGDAIFYGGVLGVINAEGSSMSGYRQDLPALKHLRIDGLFPGHGLFTLRDGQRHIDIAIRQSENGFLPRQIGQGDLVF